MQGEVVLSAIINLCRAAKSAYFARRLLNGQPVEVETTITVIFSLSS